MMSTSPKPESNPFRRLLLRWYQISAPPELPISAPFAERDRVRRGHLASITLLGCILLIIFALPIGLTDLPSLISMLCVLVICVVSILLNRRGFVSTAGALLVAIFDLGLVGAFLGAPHGQLNVTYVPLYDMFVLSVLFAVSILPPIWAFPIATINSLIIFLDIRFQPDRADFARLLMTGERIGIVIRPILIQFMAAIVAYLWVQGTLHAIKRADQAEAIAALERREIVRQRELEQGVQDLLAVYAQIANGNYHVRAPATKHTVLWQLNTGMNNLIGRFARLAQFEFAYHRTQDEAQRVVDAIQAQQSGRVPIWPAPSGTPLDPIIETLTQHAYGAQSYPRRPSAPSMPSTYDPTAPFASFANSYPARSQLPFDPFAASSPYATDATLPPTRSEQPDKEQNNTRGRGRMPFTTTPDLYLLREDPFISPVVSDVPDVLDSSTRPESSKPPQEDSDTR